MMASMKDRVQRIEDRRTAPSIDHVRIAEDAAVVTARLAAYADAFDPVDASMPLADRLAMSPAQHVAWAMRFAPKQADVPAIVALHRR